MIKRKIAISLMAMTVLASCTSNPVLANTDPDYNWTEEYTEYDEQYTEYEEPVIVRDVPVEQVEPTPEPEPENNPPLTPAGNMSLVDNVTTSSGTKQFLTVTSRDGHFYYLIIDYDKDGEENVHFLNQIDERDLMNLMDEDEAKELEERLAEKKLEEDAAKAALETPVTPTPESEPEPIPEPEKTITIAGVEFPQKTVVAIAALVVIGVICLIAFLVLTFRKKPQDNKPDPDADYDEDYGDEIDIPEADMEDDFDE